MPHTGLPRGIDSIVPAIESEPGKTEGEDPPLRLNQKTSAKGLMPQMPQSARKSSWELPTTGCARRLIPCTKFRAVSRERGHTGSLGRPGGRDGQCLQIIPSRIDDQSHKRPRQRLVGVRCRPNRCGRSDWARRLDWREVVSNEFGGGGTIILTAKATGYDWMVC